MIELLKGFLDTQWKKKNEVIQHLSLVTQTNVNERTFRQYVAQFDKEFQSGETELYIAHSNKGYLLTTDKDTILASLRDDEKRAMKMLRRVYRCRKALAEKNQLSLQEDNTDLYELLMKVKA